METDTNSLLYFLVEKVHYIIRSLLELSNLIIKIIKAINFKQKEFHIANNEYTLILNNNNN